ncbi:MAG: T9SS type A sorting domain-containing protein, partial [bacterium]
RFGLEQNYPNPFNPTTTISYSIAQLDFVKLKIYDLLGREVRTLVDKNQEAGTYTINLDASRLASGVYFYKLQTKNFVETKKMSLVR